MGYYFDKDGNLRDDRRDDPLDVPADAIEIERWLKDMIAADEDMEFDVESFEDGGVITSHRGLTITDAASRSWQITIEGPTWAGGKRKR
jgi:hypothetical protein